LLLHVNVMRMKAHTVLYSLLVIALAADAPIAFAQAEVYRVHPASGQPVTGRLGEITKDKVVLQIGSSTKEFAVNEIKLVQLPGAPRDLIEAQNAAADADWGRVIELLDKIPPPQLANEAVKQEVDFYRALANARLAVTGGAPAAEAQAAGTALVAYLKANPNTWHFYDTSEAVGDLLVSMGRFEQAPNFYNGLANAPWPEYKMRAAVAIGRALQAQGKHAEAIKQFDVALATDAKSKSGQAQALVAKIGKAKSAIELGRAQEGLQLLTKAIEDLPTEDTQLCATAYNALGNAYLQLKQPKDAMYAFLIVDSLYNQSPPQHAEALYHLKDLWNQLSHPDRSKEAADKLKSRYPASPWNK
jgi:tetratricopeptide (TPR) repeat protein